ncbi:hypothetical protein D9758_007325 [Tetrapyrgos nigripes]|uniref:Uncharacterized protein n=1 Tax=Tetrapyrgos nigripes TaxID=182062 RepID=A0A8H5GB33_9AGAR|nr:hypothetical protein D9758_007325 [Tetrapyrgos nigripes]
MCLLPLSISISIDLGGRLSEESILWEDGEAGLPRQHLSLVHEGQQSADNILTTAITTANVTVVAGSEHLSGQNMVSGAPPSARSMTDAEGTKALNEKAEAKKKKKKDARKEKDGTQKAPKVLANPASNGLQPYEQVKLNLETILAGLADDANFLPTRNLGSSPQSSLFSSFSDFTQVYSSTCTEMHSGHPPGLQLRGLLLSSTIRTLEAVAMVLREILELFRPRTENEDRNKSQNGKPDASSELISAPSASSLQPERSSFLFRSIFRSETRSQIQSFTNFSRSIPTLKTLRSLLCHLLSISIPILLSSCGPHLSNASSMRDSPNVLNNTPGSRLKFTQVPKPREVSTCESSHDAPLPQALHLSANGRRTTNLFSTSEDQLLLYDSCHNSEYTRSERQSDKIHQQTSQQLQERNRLEAERFLDALMANIFIPIIHLLYPVSEGFLLGVFTPFQKGGGSANGTARKKTNSTKTSELGDAAGKTSSVPPAAVPVDIRTEVLTLFRSTFLTLTTSISNASTVAGTPNSDASSSSSLYLEDTLTDLTDYLSLLTTRELVKLYSPSTSSPASSTSLSDVCQSYSHHHSKYTPHNPSHSNSNGASSPFGNNLPIRLSYPSNTLNTNTTAFPEHAPLPIPFSKDAAARGTFENPIESDIIENRGVRTTTDIHKFVVVGDADDDPAHIYLHSHSRPPRPHLQLHSQFPFHTRARPHPAQHEPAASKSDLVFPNEPAGNIDLAGGAGGGASVSAPTSETGVRTLGRENGRVQTKIPVLGDLEANHANAQSASANTGNQHRRSAYPSYYPNTYASAYPGAGTHLYGHPGARYGGPPPYAFPSSLPTSNNSDKILPSYASSSWYSRIQKLARKDTAWYLCAMLHVLIEFAEGRSYSYSLPVPGRPGAESAAAPATNARATTTTSSAHNAIREAEKEEGIRMEKQKQRRTDSEARTHTRSHIDGVGTDISYMMDLGQDEDGGNDHDIDGYEYGDVDGPTDGYGYDGFRGVGKSKGTGKASRQRLHGTDDIDEGGRRGNEHGHEAQKEKEMGKKCSGKGNEGEGQGAIEKKRSNFEEKERKKKKNANQRVDELQDADPNHHPEHEASASASEHERGGGGGGKAWGHFGASGTEAPFSNQDERSLLRKGMVDALLGLLRSTTTTSSTSTFASTSTYTAGTFTSTSAGRGKPDPATEPGTKTSAGIQTRRPGIQTGPRTEIGFGGGEPGKGVGAAAAASSVQASTPPSSGSSCIHGKGTRTATEIETTTTGEVEMITSRTGTGTGDESGSGVRINSRDGGCNQDHETKNQTENPRHRTIDRIDIDMDELEKDMIMAVVERWWRCFPDS